MNIWKTFLELGQAVQWLSPTTRQLFSNNSPQPLLEVLFYGKHLEYIRQLLSGSMRIELHPVRYLSSYLLENHDPEKEIEPTLTPPLLSSMLVMLGAKLFQHNETSENNMSKDKQEMIENKQYQIAITAEVLLFCQVFHATVIDVNERTISELCSKDLDCSLKTNVPEKMLHKGNKLAVLIGDLLMARFFSQLASIKNSQVAETFNNAYIEYTELMMLSMESTPKTGAITRFAFDIAYSGLSQLIGKSFRSVAAISGQGKDGQILAEELGSLIGSIIQANVVGKTMKHKSHPTVNDNDKETSLEIEQLKNKTIELISQIRGSSPPSQAAKSLVALIQII